MERITKEEIKEIINEHAERGTTLYSIQYHDYEQDEWTIPVLLTEKRAEQILTDDSVRTVKLFYRNELLILVP